MAKLDAEYQAAEASLRAAERAAEREVRAMDSPRIDAALDEFAKIANRIGLYGPSFAPRPTSPDQQDFIRLALITGQLSERPKTRAEAMRMVDRALEQLDGLEAESAHGVHVVGRDEDGEPSYTVPDHLIGDLREWAAERFGATRRTLEAIRARFEEAAEADEEQPGSASKGPEAPDARLADLIGRWGRERSPGAKTRQEMRHAVACFERVNGPLPFRRITDEHARRFKDDLLGDGVIKAATMAKLWSMVGTLMRVARHDDLVAAHPFERVKLGRLKDDAARREDFSRGDLEAVFAALNGEERWIARLALYTGARLGELCQLTKADLAERDGVAYLRIRADQTKGQRVKNRGSVRDVPLHRQLLADGFAAWARARPGERLFSFSSALASKRLLRRFAAVGLGEGKVVHSLRHTFKTVARGVMGQEWHDALTGHAGGSVSNSYGRFPVRDLKAKIDLVAFGIETG